MPPTATEIRNEKLHDVYKHGVNGAEEEIPFESGKTRYAFCPFDRPIKAIELYFVAQVVISGSSAGAVRTDGVLNLFKNIIIAVGGQNQKWKIDGRSLYIKNAIENKTLMPRTDPSAATDATYDIDVAFRISLENDIGLNPADTFFDATKFPKKLRIGVDWGAPKDMFTSAFNGTATISSSYSAKPVYEQSNETTDIRYERRCDYMDYTVTANKSDFLIALQCDVPRIYQNILFMTLDDDERTADIIDKLTLKVTGGVLKIDNLDFDHLISENTRKSLLGTNFPVGIGYVNFMEQKGRISRALDVSIGEIVNADFILNVLVGSGVTTIRVVQDYLVPSYLTI